MMSLLSRKAIVITALGNKHANSLQNPLAMTEVDDIYYDGSGPRKRRRLTHLSPDEKMLRRKLKNRVAAQTARDRKKALMTELEEQVAKLQEQNKRLMKENAELRISRSTLQQENHRLKKCLSDTTTTSTTTSAATDKLEGTDSLALSCKPEPDSPRSAAPAVSLPKEQIQALSRLMMHYAACALTVSLMLCLACYKSSTEKVESSSRKRKQTRPARRPSATLECLPLTENCSPRAAWWGPHQQSWNPSMN